MAGTRNLSIPGVTVIFNDGEIGVMLRGAQGEVGRDVQRRAYAVQKRMKRLAPVWSGEMRDGIHVESDSSTHATDGPASRVVSDAEHTLVNEFGRGPVKASGLGYPGRPTVRGAGRGRMGLQPGGTSTPGLPLSNRRKNFGGTRYALTIYLTPGSRGGQPSYFAAEVGPAKGSHFMENSIDAAAD